MFRLVVPSLVVLPLLLGWQGTQTQPVPKNQFPAPYNSGTEKDKSPPLSAAAVVAKMKLPPGFQATVFAAEPDVQNPIAMAWDGKGRLWVAENYTYAEMAVRFDLKLRDRILIFEDPLGDGHFKTRRVFTDKLQRLMSVAVGLGGVWAMCPPQLLFIPDRGGGGVPDGEPIVVLDGFTVAQQGSYHTIANGLRFGPDGWLYGRCGGSNPGQVGPPGTPAEERTPLRGSMWRYHPQRKVVEVLSHGTTNPWGHDWDEHGELFFINTTNGHLWHEIPGAHYTRGTTKDPNPRAYDLIDMHADHWHWDKELGFKKARGDTADAYGGGHAHVGMTIYQGDNWPAEYRGRLLTINMFGHRVNQEILEREGSGYVGRRGDDMIFVPDPWFRGMELSYGPDGGVFMLDWSDTGDYHDHSGVHRESGRIYKITFGKAKPSNIGDVAALSVKELLALHLHHNEWFTRQARLELMARSVDGRGVGNAKQELRKLFDKQNDVPNKLRALWSLYSLGGADEALLRAQLRNPNEHVRAWAIRMLTDSWPLDTVMSKRPAKSVAGSEVTAPADLLEDFIRLAAEDPSGLVRLVLASTLQRLPVAQRAKLAVALVGHSEDADDHNLPLLIWYGLIPVAEADPTKLVSLAEKCELPLTRKFMARRLAEDIAKNGGASVNRLLEASVAKPESYQVDILDGVAQGLKGLHKVAKPAAWDALAKKLEDSQNVTLRNRIRDLGVVFGVARALEEVRRIAADPKADIEDRKAALESVIDARPPDLRRLCEQLLGVRHLNLIAARGLATFEDPAIGPALVEAYQQFDAAERPQLIATLASRPALAAPLLSAVADKKIPRADISAFDARQIRSFNDATLNKKVAEVWGELRDSPADKQKLIAHWKAQLSTEELAKANKSNGRVLFNKTCATCHVLYGEGAKVGPDLTGGGRRNLDFLLAKIADPSALVSADFRMSVVSLKDGRVLNGIVTAKNERTLALRMTTETLTVELTEIESTKESTLSLMPEGLLETLTAEQVRDLIGYLMHPSQVPLPADVAMPPKTSVVK
jgi:putative membrane-bound dehydrogenase-like protein